MGASQMIRRLLRLGRLSQSQMTPQDLFSNVPLWLPPTCDHAWCPDFTCHVRLEKFRCNLALPQLEFRLSRTSRFMNMRFSVKIPDLTCVGAKAGLRGKLRSK